MNSIVVGALVGLAVYALLRHTGRQQEHLLFLTHTPGDHTEPGHEWVHPTLGTTFVVTQMRPTSPTALIDGGIAPCWKVFGRPRALGHT